MSASRFCRYELRTIDVNAARDFYERVLGPEIWTDDVTVVPLPERARARGAPSHWLGHIGVGEVDAMAERIVAAGGQRLGDTQRAADGSLRAPVRDPFGAPVAVSSATGRVARATVEWHLLNVHDHRKAFALYAELFDWTALEARDQGPDRCSHQLFTWEGRGRPAGSIADTARLPGVHTHWLYHFRVPDLAAATAKVGALGGRSLQAHRTITGDHVVACDDPQGGAFGLFQAA
jgi:predicted enzyme related to lactoylglutathione lyase